MAEVSLHPSADAEYAAALAWSQARSPRAATGFEEAVEQALEFIGQFPEASPGCGGPYRDFRLARYANGVVYRVDGDNVRVVAVTHASRLPGYWAGR